MALQDHIVKEFLNKKKSKQKATYRVFDEPNALKEKECSSLFDNNTSAIQQIFSSDNTNGTRLESNKDAISNQLVNNKGPISNQDSLQLISSKVLNSAKLQSNKDSISNQLVTNNGSITTQDSVQLVTNKLPDSAQLESNKSSISNQLVTNKYSISTQKSAQLVNKNTPYSFVLEAVGSLYGLQKNLIIYIVKSCCENSALHTKKITSIDLKIILNTTHNAIKTATQRLINKGLINRNIGKRGKGGYVIFSITETVRNCVQEALNNGSISILKSNQLGCNKVPTAHSSSSLDLNHITTDYCSSALEQPFEFDLEPLADIGFTLNHVKQILKQGKLTSEEIQESIHHFAFDLTHNDKLKTIKTNPLAFFMGTLKRGDYYNPSSNYESQKSRNMRLLLEAKTKREFEEKEIENKLKASEYNDWVENLPDAELMQFYLEEQDISNVPDKIQKTLIRRNALNNARQYFDSEIWPKRKKELEVQIC